MLKCPPDFAFAHFVFVALPLRSNNSALNRNQNLLLLSTKAPTSEHQNRFKQFKTTYKRKCYHDNYEMLF